MLDHHLYGEQNGQHQIGCLHAARKELFSVQLVLICMQPDNSCFQCNWRLSACTQKRAVISATGAGVHAGRKLLLTVQPVFVCMQPDNSCFQCNWRSSA